MNQEKFDKYLGVLIDEHFTFSNHFDYICNKLNRGLFCINRIKNILNPKALLTIYYSIFHSHLLYCNIILSCANNAQIKRISTLQKKAIRAITKSAYNTHTAPLFNQLKILPFEKLMLLNRSLFMHSIHYKYQHASFNNIFIQNQHRNTDHTLRNLENFYLPLPKTEAFKRTTCYLLPKTWNDLPDTIKCQNNRFTFKIALTNEIFHQLEVENQNL